jgi:16S rRNA (cytosine967-C5)-methyltransferase
LQLHDWHYDEVRAEKPRQIAVRVLRDYAEGADYLEDLLEPALAGAGLSPPDRALVKELACGVVRWQATLDWLIAQKTRGAAWKSPVQILLRLGLYQIAWLDRIPGHAAVYETVELAKQLGFGRQAGFINAVLRGCLRELEPTRKTLATLKTSQPALGFSHPEWLCERWQKRWGQENLRRLLEWNNTPPVAFARMNRLRAAPEQLMTQWEAEGVRYVARQFDWVPERVVFELSSAPPLTALPSFQQGLFYVQDPGTLLAVTKLDPQPGESVLDLCAAPGGKTTLIAQLMQNRGRIVARDNQPQRLQLIEENCARLSVSCVETALAAVPASPAAPPQLFDRVLVDAPCSNTGVMRRRVDLRWRLRPQELDRLRAGQLELLHQAALELKPGGTLVYSTCSLEPEENQDVAKEFLSSHAEFHLEDERTLLPFVEEVDGAYVARFRQRPLAAERVDLRKQARDGLRDS